MRTTIDLPDPLYRQLKAHAALQGVPMKDVVLAFVERGLRAPAGAAKHEAPPWPGLPTLPPTGSLPLQSCSNAALFELLESAEPSLRQPAATAATAATAGAAGLTGMPPK